MTPDHEDKNHKSFEEDFEQRIEKFGEYFDGGRITWAVFLIFIGTLLFLNTTGVIGWSIWGFLWRFWPLFIILLGVQIILGSSKIAKLAYSVIIILALLGVGFWALAYSNPDIASRWGITLPEFLETSKTDPGEVLNKKVAITTEQYDPSEIVTTEIVIDLSTSEAVIEDKDRDEYFILDAQYYNEWGVPVVKSEMVENKLDINFSQESDEKLLLSHLGVIPKYDIQLGQPDKPTKLDLNISAGSASVTLETQKISSINSKVGAGSIEFKIEDNSLPRDLSTFEVGAGATTLKIPANTAIMINYQVGLGSLSYLGENIASFAGEGTYKSDNYDSSEIRIELNVSVGAGSFAIEKI